MYEISAEYYDLVYNAKDYEREAEIVRRLVAGCRPGAQSLLDVACGTGAHDHYLSRYYEVDGLDANPVFLQKARERNPRGRYSQADMRGFCLDRLYDVIVCLFSGIGHARTLEEVRRTLSCMREHLAEGGLVLVEPWFQPEQWRTGEVHVHQVERDGVTICRMSHSGRRGRLSVSTIDYLVGTHAGLEYVREEHELGLFEVGEMEEAFGAAGLEVEYDAEGLSDRGLYMGRRKEGS